MFGFSAKEKIEKRKLTYEKLAADLVAKMERCKNPDLLETIGEVYDSVNGMAVTVESLDTKQDKRVKAKLVHILGISDATYPDVKQRFEKDCREVVNIVAGAAKVGYKLNIREKKKQKQRLAKEGREAQLEDAIQNVELFGNEILELDDKINECNARIRKEKDESKAVLILRERKNLERMQKQKVALKDQNDRIITLAANEHYLEEQKKINDKFDLKRMASTAREMQKMAAEQAINDRLYDEIMAMTDKSMGMTSGSVTAAELAELRSVKKEVETKEKERVFERADDIIATIEEEYEDQLETEELI